MASHPGLNELANDITAPLSYSNMVLSQFLGAGIDAYTINYTRLICSQYHDSPHIERDFNNSLTNLPLFAAADPALQFGWGENYVLRNAGVHRFGYEHLILAAAMAECLSEDYVAAVFSVLGDQLVDLAQGRVKPLIGALRGLVHAANGVFSNSEFGLTVDDRVRLNPYGGTSGMAVEVLDRMLPPKVLAGAIDRLGKLRGAEEGKREMTVIGGNMLGLLAAAAEMVLDVSVTITDKEGKELYRFKTGGDAHIKLVYTPETELEIDKMTEKMGNCLCLATGHNPNTDLVGPPLPFTGRLVWESLLPKTFGSVFHTLAHQESKSLAAGIGCVARGGELSMLNKGQTDFFSVLGEMNPAIWGIGLINTVTVWFPDLRHLQGRMERQLKLDAKGCSDGALGAVHHLENLCNCRVCAQKDPESKPAKEFCLPIVMETILMMAFSLSRLVVAAKLYPSRAGVLCIYHNQVQRRIETRKYPVHSLERQNILFGNELNGPPQVRLQHAAALFSGFWPEKDVPDNLVALSHEGVCAYLMMAQKGDAKQRPDDLTIRVTSGNICWKQYSFTRACLGPVKKAGIADGWEPINCEHLKEPLYVK